MKLESQQARILNRTLLSGMFVRLGVVVALVLGLYVLFETALKPAVSDFVAAQTTQGWRALNSADQFEALLTSFGFIDEDGTEGSQQDKEQAAWAEGQMMELLRSQDAQGNNQASDSASGSVDLSVGASEASSPNEGESDGSELAYAVVLPDEFPYFLRPTVEDDQERIVVRAQDMGLSQDQLHSLLGELVRLSQQAAYDEWSAMDPRTQAMRLGLDNPNPVWDVNMRGDGEYLIRDVALYQQVAALKIPFFVGLLLVGFLVVVARTLNRAIRCFDELSLAVGGLLEDKDAPIDLPDSLSVARNELALIQSKAQADERAAKQAEQRKNELVAYLAHDIRTPLTSVLGYLDLLSESQGLPPATERRYARIAYEKAQRLEGLVDEFFEITRYNLQSIPIERQNADVLLFCQQIADAFYPETSARGIKIEVDVPETTQFFVDCDKLARALGNVMRNAVAYAEDGTRITLRAVVDQQSNDVLLSVSDQGREISEAHLEAIFEKFFREDGARGSAHGGAGLGLAVAKEIVDAHGGSICAQSTNGLTTFTMRLPAGGWLGE